MDVANPVVIAAIAAVVGGIIGLLVGKSGGGKGAAESPTLKAGLANLLKELQEGSVSEKGGGKELDALRAAIATWAPRGAERDVALRTALTRMHTFLDTNIDGPLRLGQDGKRSLSSAVKQARSAVQDLEFFLSDPSGDSKREDLNGMVRSTARDFANEWDCQLKIGASPEPVHVMANSGGLNDALFLIFHNAAQFGKTTSASVEVKGDKEWGRVIVRDDGPGFTAEALARAYDPFYSTTKGGLGIGLSHARNLVEKQGGLIHLRNAAGGGAEVEIALPVSG